MSTSSVDGASEELTVLEEFEGILFDGTDDQFVVRSEHELHLLQHAITTTRFKLASKVKAIASTSDIVDPVKALTVSGPGSLDLGRFMLLAVGGAAHIHSVLVRKDGSMPVVVVKWQYNKKAAHDRAYHAVKVPTHSGTVLFEHYRPRRTSLREQPNIAAPWRQEADFAAGRVLPSSTGAAGHAPHRIEQRPIDEPPSMFMMASGSGGETPTSSGAPASRSVAQQATGHVHMEQRPLDSMPLYMEQRPSNSMPSFMTEQRPSNSMPSFMTEQRPSDDFPALQQRGRVASMPPLQEGGQQQRGRSHK